MNKESTGEQARRLHKLLVELDQERKIARQEHDAMAEDRLNSVIVGLDDVINELRTLVDLLLSREHGYREAEAGRINERARIERERKQPC